MLRGTSLLRWLLLPLARTGLIQAAIVTLVLTLNNFAVPAILQVKVFPAEIWVRFNTTFDYAAALALSWPLIVAPLLLVGCLRRQETAWSWRSDAPAAQAMRRQLGAGWRRTGGAAAVALLVLSLGIPLWQLAGSAKTWRQLAPALAAGRADAGPFPRLCGADRHGGGRVRIVDMAAAPGLAAVGSVFYAGSFAGDRADLALQPLLAQFYLSKRRRGRSGLFHPLCGAGLDDGGAGGARGGPQPGRRGAAGRGLVAGKCCAMFIGRKSRPPWRRPGT